MMPADIEISAGIHKQTRTTKLCRHCADQMDIPVTVPRYPVRSQDVLAGLIGNDREPRCRICGCSSYDVLHAGELGCDSCLDYIGVELADRLMPADKRTRHSVETGPYHTDSLPPNLAHLRSILFGADMLTAEPGGASAVRPFQHVSSYEWYLQRGPADDVVIATRVASVRSLTAVPIAARVTAEAATEVIGVLQDMLDEQGTVLDSQDAAILLERSLLDNPDDCPVYSFTSDGIEILIGGHDHLRCIAVSAGLQLHGMIAAVAELSERIDAVIAPRARMDFGYVTRSLASLGGGIQLSAVLHVWSLAAFGILDAAMSEAVVNGLQWSRTSSDRVRVYTTASLALSKAELSELLEGCIVTLVHYERKARADMLRRRSGEWRDVLQTEVVHCVSVPAISQEDSLRVLSNIRVSAYAEMLSGLTPERVNQLEVSVLDGHIRRLYPENSSSWTREALDQARAALLRSSLHVLVDDHPYSGNKEEE